MFAVLTILAAFTGSTPTVVSTPAPPNAMLLHGTQRTISAASTNIQTAKDRIYQVQAMSVVTTDYLASVSRLDTVNFVSDTSNDPIDPVSGRAPFSAPAVANLFANTLISGTYASYDVIFATNNANASSNVVGFVNLSLASNLVFSVSNAFSGKSVSNWGYNPGQADLGSNTVVWTSSQTLMSCIGTTSSTLQTCLISPTNVLGNNHIAGIYANGQTVTFTDTNGIKRIATFTGFTSGPGDCLIGNLSSPVTNSVVPASILPVYATNNITSWLGVFSIWAHRNTSHVDLGYVAQYPVNAVYIGANGMFCSNARTNIFGNEIGATGGDSGSPCGFILGSSFVVAFTATSPGDVSGDFVTDGLYWNFITNNIPVASLNVVNLSGYPTY